MVQGEGGGRGHVSEHDVQLFDDLDSLTETLTAYLFEGWQEDDTLLVVARPQLWSSVSGQLESLGYSVDDAIRSRRLSVLNARTVLGTLMRNGRIVHEKFEQKVASLVRSLSEAFGRPLRIYGEMVDVLAAEENFAAVIELERLWNQLTRECSFKLLCGYSSAHFGDERTAATLKRICAEHDHATARSSDLLASWLLAERAAIGRTTA
jgi:hypothetical protein